MKLRDELQAVLDGLLHGSEPGGEVSLDRIGEALGTQGVGIDEVEAIISGLEAAGRKIVGTVGADPKSDLRTVMATAHALRATGSAPTIIMLAERTGLSEARVRAALRLGQIIGR